MLASRETILQERTYVNAKIIVNFLEQEFLGLHDMYILKIFQHQRAATFHSCVPTMMALQESDSLMTTMGKSLSAHDVIGVTFQFETSDWNKK